MLDKLLFNSSAASFTQQVALDKSSEFREIAEKIIADERLSLEDGYKIIRSNEIIILGQLANFVRQRKAYEVALRKGFDKNIALEQIKTVWWNTNLHLNPTNICIAL